MSYVWRERPDRHLPEPTPMRIANGNRDHEQRAPCRLDRLASLATGDATDIEARARTYPMIDNDWRRTREGSAASLPPTSMADGSPQRAPQTAWMVSFSSGGGLAGSLVLSAASNRGGSPQPGSLRDSQIRPQVKIWLWQTIIAPNPMNAPALGS